MGAALLSMVVSCGSGESSKFEDLQEGVQRENKMEYDWVLLPFCHIKEYHYDYIVVKLRNGSTVKFPESPSCFNDEEYVRALSAAVDAKDYKKADYIFNLIKTAAMTDYSFKEVYTDCLGLYLKNKVTALLEEGSVEAKDQIITFLNNYETVDEKDEAKINNVCDDVFARALRSSDRSLAERMVRCYRQDEETLKNGKTVKTWTSKNAAKKQLEDAIKSGDI